jgi:hypothetical protein
MTNPPARNVAAPLLRRCPGRPVSLTLALIALVGAASTAAGGEASRYFPLAEGTRWTYREQIGVFGVRRRIEVTARGPRAVRGLERPLFVFQETGDRPFLGIDDSGFVGFLVEDGFVLRFSARGEDSRGELRIFGEGGVRMLPLAPRAGQRWEQESHLFVTPESSGAPRRWSAEVSLLDSLSVPAGRYRDLVRVVTRYWDPDLSTGEPQITFEDFYAAGVGLVRSVARNHERGRWSRVVRELVEFHPRPPR